MPSVRRDRPVPLVRLTGPKRSREVLHRRLQELEDHAISRYGEAGQEIHGRQPGSVMTVAFELDGQPFTALNGGPVFKFNEADLAPGQLRHAGGSRLLLGQALGRAAIPRRSSAAG